jgi:predicted transcriptional regulator YdeE
MKGKYIILVIFTVIISCKPKTKDLEQLSSFKVIGISIETTNENQQSEQDIGLLWNRFFSENVISKIPNKLSDEVYSLYTDYESDYTGKYTAILGMKVSSLDSIPDGMNGREFKTGTYKKFKAKTLEPESVVEVWQEVWEKNQELDRKYTVDFEVHKQDSKTEVFIAVNQ